MTVAELKRFPKDTKQSFEAILVLRKVAIKKAKNGSPFLTVELGDKSGLFHIVCFENSINFQIFSDLDPGAIVAVSGATGYYQNRFSPQVNTVTLVPPEQREKYADQLVESAPEDVNELAAELNRYVSEMSHEGLKITVRSALDELGDDFLTMPGAISMHHAYRGGLLEHTVRMVRNCRALLPLHPEIHDDLAIAGIILHDIGKCLEYSGVLGTQRTRNGILNGHVVLGYRQARRSAIQAKLSDDLRDRLEHIILSHQGELEWGAAVKAATPEAVFVSMIDNLDAKMGMVQNALRNTSPDDQFSEFIPGLGAPLLVSPIQEEEPAPPEHSLSADDLSSL